MLCRRPFWKLNGGQEVDPFTGWDELDRDHFYSQVQGCNTWGSLLICRETGTI